MTIHHATLAKAQKLGVVITEQETKGGTQVVAHWTERNRKFYADSAAAAPALVEDMKTVRTIILEYPQLKLTQGDASDGYMWTISLRKDVLATASRGKLADAWDEAFEVLQTNEGDEAAAEDAEDEAKIDVEGKTEEDDNEGKSVVRRKYKTRYRPWKMTNGDEIAQLVSAHIKVKGDDGKMHVDLDHLIRFAKANGCWVDSYMAVNNGMKRMNVVNRLRARIRQNPDYEIVWAK